MGHRLQQVDSDMLRNELDASPVRLQAYGQQDEIITEQGQDRSYFASTDIGEEIEEPEQRESVEERPRAQDAFEIEEIRGQPSQRPGMGRERRSTQTELINYLERHPTALERIETHRNQHLQTVGTAIRSRQSTRKDLPLFGANKPYPKDLPDKEEYVVEFNGHDDPLHAQNWSTKKKIGISAILILDSLSATFSSSVFSAASQQLQADFAIGGEVATLGTSLFVLGYAFGPIIWAPMSELYGRRVPIIIAAFAFSVFAIGVSTAKDIQTVMICRFFEGLFGSCPLAVVAACFADMYNNKYRGLAVACFSATVFMGPLMGPFIGGFIAKSYLGWRWTQYIVAFMGFAACILALLFQSESYPPVILVDKAKELRRRTKNWGIHAKQEEVEVDLKELLTKNTTRPLRILFQEPIVLLVTIYMSFLYGLLYLFLTAYGIVFGQIYGFSQGVSGLPYFGMIIGMVLGFICVALSNPAYARKLEANNNIPIPEWRLPIVIVGGISFAVGLFWFGWTGFDDSIPWIVPTLSGLCSGFGIFTVFLQLLNYIVDSYLMFAASAIAANTFMRSLFGAIFPLFATYMFNGIGINWGMTLLGCVATVLVPMPICFYIYGRKIRAKSTFAPAPDIEQDKKRDEESRDYSDSQHGRDAEDIESVKSSAKDSPGSKEDPGRTDEDAGIREKVD